LAKIKKKFKFMEHVFCAEAHDFQLRWHVLYEKFLIDFWGFFLILFVVIGGAFSHLGKYSWSFQEKKPLENSNSSKS
jgi:hypothetical protein